MFGRRARVEASELSCIRRCTCMGRAVISVTTLNLERVVERGGDVGEAVRR